MQGRGIDLARTPAGLAVERHDRFRAQRGEHAADPAAKSRLKLARIDQTEQAAKRVVRGDTVLKLEIAPQPIQACFGPLLDFDKGIGSDQHAVDRDHQHFNQIVPDF